MVYVLLLQASMLSQAEKKKRIHFSLLPYHLNRKTQYEALLRQRKLGIKLLWRLLHIHLLYSPSSVHALHAHHEHILEKLLHECSVDFARQLHGSLRSPKDHGEPKHHDILKQNKLH